ncbi:hypothetical protein A0H81_08849 [Grifola frondosa]|uniref:Uncharacterized protein n=1 Tax=Grifola frondosa TaxID=5627 RepID=A0A1C7M5C5_GRIFR|nr:hypothetical protein A0H81_08849 [Grifola frondosa]
MHGYARAAQSRSNIDIYKPSFLLGNLKSQSTSTTESNTEKPAATPPSLLSFPFVLTNHPTSLSSTSLSLPNSAHPNIPSSLTTSAFIAPSVPPPARTK